MKIITWLFLGLGFVVTVIGIALLEPGNVPAGLILCGMLFVCGALTINRGQ